MNIQIPALLNGDVRRAVHTTRYSRQPVLRVESVAEHVYNTVTYASVLAHHLRTFDYDLDMGVVLNKALWHDLEEPAGTGDVLRSVKYSSHELLYALEVLGRREVKRVSESLGVPRINTYWEDSKDDSVEGQIVRVADALSVAAYLVEEHRMGNRSHAELHYEFVGYLVDVYNKVRIPELQDFVLQVRDYFKEQVNYQPVESTSCAPTSR